MNHNEGMSTTRGRATRPAREREMTLTGKRRASLTRKAQDCHRSTPDSPADAHRVFRPEVALHAYIDGAPGLRVGRSVARRL